jgi:hypothetical protein
VDPGDRVSARHFRSTILRWVALILMLVVAIGASLAPIVISDQPGTFDHILNTSMPLWYIAAGLVVMAKRPWHQIGWLMILIGLGLSTTSLPVPASRLDPEWYPWLAWIGTWGGVFLYTVIAAFLVAFPDGLSRRPERDRRIGRRIVGFMAVLTVLAAMSSPVEIVTVDGGTSTFPNPLVQWVPVIYNGVVYIPIFGFLFGCVVWMWRRQRREHGEERRRYTLVLYAFSVLIVALIFGISLSATLGDIAWLGALVGWYLLPGAFAYAVIRHGLYGIDRLVRRTVSYGLIAIAVAAVYVLPVVLLPRLLGESNDLVIASSTLAAAAAFNPVRRRIQRAVDHRFDRARYDAEREVDAFAARLTGEIALTTVTGDLDGVIRRTLAPSSSALWLKSRP